MARFSIVAALMFLAALSNALPTANDFPGSVDEAMNKAMEAADQALEVRDVILSHFRYDSRKNNFPVSFPLP